MRALLTAVGILVGAACSFTGLVVMSWGAFGLGLAMFGGGLLLTMGAAGAGLPRPDVVPRPGEESEYVRGD